MSEATHEAEAAQPEAEQNEETQADTTDWKAEARKWEARAKENSGAAKAAEKARLDAMTESERAIEEARQAARAEATTAYGKRLAQSEIRAAAADATADLAGVFDYLDLSRFVQEDGEPDSKAIKAFVDALPKKDAGPAGFDGGARSTSKQPDMNDMLRRAAGRA